MTDISGRPTEAQLAPLGPELDDPLKSRMYDVPPEGWAPVGVCMPGEVLEVFRGQTYADRQDAKHGGPENWGLMRREDGLLDVIAAVERNIEDTEYRPTLGTLAVAGATAIVPVEQDRQ
jgi:hypothetical protein